MLRSFVKHALHEMIEANEARSRTLTFDMYRAFNEKRNKAINLMRKYVGSYYIQGTINNAYRIEIKHDPPNERTLYWEKISGYVSAARGGANDNDRDWFVPFAREHINHGDVIPAFLDSTRRASLDIADIELVDANNLATVLWNSKATKDVKPIEALSEYPYNDKYYIIEWEALYRAIDVSSTAVQLSAMLNRLALKKNMNL
jgi:hypothetical protein